MCRLPTTVFRHIAFRLLCWRPLRQGVELGTMAYVSHSSSPRGPPAKHRSLWLAFWLHVLSAEVCGRARNWSWVPWRTCLIHHHQGVRLPNTGRCGWLFGCTCCRRRYAGGQGTGSSGLGSESDSVTLKSGRLDGLVIKEL